jgi:hypothetical protein
MTQPQRQWVATGDEQEIDAGALDNRVPEYDPRTGDHLWIVATMYRVVPQHWRDRTHTPTLDRENLLSITRPCCFYCEQAYSARLASRRCRGGPR